MLRASLFRKYALIFSAVVVGSLLVSGSIEVYFSYQENKSALIELQREKAESSASRIGQYISDIEQRIAFTSPPRPGIGALENRRSEIEALSQVSAITEIALLDSSGMERFRVSSLGPVASKDRKDYSQSEVFRNVKSGKPYRSPVYFLRDAEPYITIAMAVGAKEAGVTVAEVHLEFLLEGISRIKVGKAGYAYAVDERGQLIAHPDISLVLKKTNLSSLPQIKAALNHVVEEAEHAAQGRDLSGKPVLTAYDTIPQLGWFVFVEQPRSEAYAPLYASIARTGLLLLAGLVLSLFASMLLVRRMVAPIHALQKGAMLIGSGSLDQRIEVNTGDELESLAGQFNRMAGQLRESYAGLEEKVQVRTQELADKNIELERAYRTLEEVSLTDPLTGLHNRRFLVQMLETETALTLRRYDEWLLAGAPRPTPDIDLVFFMVDIDHFKSVNDRYGHAAGDTVLAQVPERLRQVFRESDLLIRWGGEEFLVVARAMNRIEAEVVAERIRVVVASRDFDLGNGMHLPLTCSIGFACFPFLPLQPRLFTWPQIAELADRGLYMVKHGKRNSWAGLLGTEYTQTANLFERLIHETDSAAQCGDVRIISRENTSSVQMASTGNSA